MEQTPRHTKQGTSPGHRNNQESQSIKADVAKNPTRAANMDGHECLKAKASPLPLNVVWFGGKSSICFMQFKFTSVLVIILVAFPVVANIVMRGVILLPNGSLAIWGKVATPRVS